MAQIPFGDFDESRAEIQVFIAAQISNKQKPLFKKVWVGDKMLGTLSQKIMKVELYLKGNYYWRDPFFTSMIMGERVKRGGSGSPKPTFHTNKNY